MAGISDKVQIGNSADFLEGVAVDTAAGNGLFREGVVVSDPELEGARQRVLDTEPAADDFGAVVRVAGIPLVDIQAGYSNNDPLFVGWNGSQQVTVSGTVSVQTNGATRLNVDAAQEGAWAVSINNFPATQTVSGTVTANLGTLNGAATEANQATGNASLSSVDAKLPDLSGAWGYDSGVSGSVTIGVGKRVLQITAVAGALGATMTINGGSTVTIPALTSIAIEPRGNLIAPSLVFTGTTGYFVEHVS